MRIERCRWWCCALALSASLLPFQGAAQTLGAALNNTNLAWTVGGSGTWLGQSAITHDGVFAAGSTGTAEFDNTWFETTVTGPGAITFWWKVSEFVLSFSVDGVELTNAFWYAPWTEQSIPVPAGPHLLRWNYFRGPSWQGLGDTHGYVDQVSFVPSNTSGLRFITTGPDAPAVNTKHEFRCALATETGVAYFIEYAGAVTNRDWQVLTNFTGNGAVVPVTDPLLPNTNRFYRIRAASPGS